MKNTVFKTLLSLIIAAAMLLAALPATLTAFAGEVSTTVLRVRSSEDFYDALWGTCQNNTYTVIIRLEEDIKVELEDGAQLVWMNGNNNYNMILDLNGRVLDLGAYVLKAWNYAANATYHLTDTVGTGKDSERYDGRSDHFHEPRDHGQPALHRRRQRRNLREREYDGQGDIRLRRQRRGADY
ncbi:MAG: hypothetical protein IKZ81_05345, partial [Clostridia bacterium]|nr:hypothetical protein [Clostridia bacterium]